jgi:hypothetical protein
VLDFVLFPADARGLVPVQFRATNGAIR